ncbi:MAG: uroporphyrinogen decarboxylase family protein [Eubacteriales bacterium]
MTSRENYISIAKRTGYEKVPVSLSMSPSVWEKYNQYLAANPDFKIPQFEGYVCDISPKPVDLSVFNQYYTYELKKGTTIDWNGVAHEPGSEAAYHMTYMRHPMNNFDSVEQILAYPFLDYSEADGKEQKRQTDELHKANRAAIGGMQCTIWETAWYMRGMENLMMDMMSDDPMAEVLLDRVTQNAVLRAESYARNGADAIFLGDDIGMQHSIMMSEQLYSDWIKPRLKKVIDSARRYNPDLIVFYHSCGFVTPFIPHLIDAGVDVLNPVQPECMDFSELHAQYGDKISFHGTIGTQSTMPFGTADEVRREVFINLDTAGDKGGLYVCPTHVLEPEVPIENVIAYVKACLEYK